MALNEVQRQAYLKAMGIQSYFPRFILPGAPLSKQCEWPQETVELGERKPADRPEEAGPRPASSGKGTAAERARRVTGADMPPGAGKPAQPETAAEPLEEGAGIRFSLACARAGDQACILNLMPHAGSGRLSPRHRALLVNLLGACGVDCNEMQYDDLPFRWPLLETLGMVQGEAAARQAVNAYLEQKMEERPCRIVLVLGENILSLIGARGEAQAPNRGSIPASEDRLWRLAATHSLDEMLLVPGLKREAWRALRFLRSDG